MRKAHLCDSAADSHGSVSQQGSSILVNISVTGGGRPTQTVKNLLQTEKDLTSTLRLLKQTHIYRCLNLNNYHFN